MALYLQACRPQTPTVIVTPPAAAGLITVASLAGTSPDFHLQMDSAAIGKALCLPEVTSDKDGVPRPNRPPNTLFPGDTGCDIGAYQFTGAVVPPPPTASPDGTRVPPAQLITDAAGGVWTIGPNMDIRLNGLAAAGGYGSIITWCGGQIRVLGDDASWWVWQGATWISIGPVDPCKPVDVTAPTLAFGSPTSGATITSAKEPYPTIRVTATEATTVIRMEIRLNGQLKMSLLNEKVLSFQWSSVPFKGQSVTIDALATDAAGNTGTASRKVTVK